MPHAFHLACVDGTRFEEGAQAVGQLDFSGAVALGCGERRKNVGREHVAADDRQIGRRFLFRRLLDQIADAVDSVAQPAAGIDVDHAVARNLVARHALHSEHGAVDLLKDVDQLSDRRRIRIDHVVAENHRKRFVADHLARHQHGVSEAERLALSNVREVDQVRDLADLGELIAFAARLEKRLELH